MIYPKYKKLPELQNIMSVLGDDELGQILNWVSDSDDRKSFSEVCKQWLRLEGLNRTSIRVLEPDALFRLLPRFPNLLKFETAKPITDSDLEFLAQMCPRIEVLNLNLKGERPIFNAFDGVGEVSSQGLCALAKGCPKLNKVSLKRISRICDAGLVSLVDSAHYLKHLDLGYCSLVTDQTLESIGSLSSVTILNLQGCTLITDQGLIRLANGSCSKTLKKLVLADCDRVTDYGVSLLKQMCFLEELDLCDCGPRVTDIGGVAIAAIHSLKKLKLAWLINLSDITIVALAKNCLNLMEVDLKGCEGITGIGIIAFSSHMRLEYLNLCSCLLVVSAVKRIADGCPSLKTIVVDERMRSWFLPMIPNISRVVKFVSS